MEVSLLPHPLADTSLAAFLGLSEENEDSKCIEDARGRGWRENLPRAMQCALRPSAMTPNEGRLSATS